MTLKTLYENHKQDSTQLGFVTLAGTKVPPLLQMPMLCVLLGVDQSTIWRWVRGRGFPKAHVAVGAKVRMWRAVDVENWLNSQATTAAAMRQAAASACYE